MGACISNEERTEKLHSFSIDRTIEEEGRKMEREIKILLLGKIHLFHCIIKLLIYKKKVVVKVENQR